MATVTITINGKPAQARVGQTVLEAAADAGIDIPALCHHPALPPQGSCRVCLVEIEKQRTLQPACTFPVSDGLVIQTESKKVVAARKFALEMIFSERQHYCMFCPMSGSDSTTDCELQKLAYRYGLTHWLYAPNYMARWPIDASRQHFVMDHSRCILCRRCIRACDAIAANHSLGVHQRGARTMVCADDDLPFGKSTCVSCGTCLQVCPTGALMDRRSAYMGHETDTQRTRTTCMACSVGCGIEAVTRNNRLLRVEGDWGAANAGMLCAAGRFEMVDDGHERLMRPLVRRHGGMVETDWDEALGLVAQRLQKAKRVAGMISPRTTNQSLIAFQRFFADVLRSDQVALLHGRVPPLDLGPAASLQDIPTADLIVVISGDPLNDQPVIGYLAHRALDRGAKLVVASGEATKLDAAADLALRLESAPRAAPGAVAFGMPGLSYHLRADRVALVRNAVELAQKPVVLYGGGLDDEICAALRAFPNKTRFLPLVQGTNAVGAARVGLGVRPVQGEVLYVLAGDDQPNGTPLPAAQFTVIQAAYRRPWTDGADVILPARRWMEKTGHVINIEGRRLAVKAFIEAPSAILENWATLFILSVKMGRSLSCVTVTDSAAAL